MNLARDLRYAFRLAWKTPWFSLAVILTLGLCIGANTAIFSIVDHVLLRSLPYPEPDRLALVARFGKAGSFQQSQNGWVWEAIRDQATLIDAAVEGSSSGVNFGAGDSTGFVKQQRVSSGYFRVMGVPPLLGREFTPEEDRPTGPPVAILGYQAWQRYFQLAPSAIGSKILLRGEPSTVIGVMPASFRPQARVDLWTPLRPTHSGEGSGSNYRIVARLRPGVENQQAAAQLAAIFEILQKDHGTRAEFNGRLSLVGFQRGATDDLRRPLLMLWEAVGLVLLIGCVNISGMLLARASGRSAEMATRLALGAGRSVLIRQLLAESLLFAAAGGALGILIGRLVLAGLVRLGSRNFGLLLDVTLDSRVLLATAAATLVTSLVFGLLPALQVSRVDLRSAQGTRAVAGRRRQLPLAALASAQIGLSVPLLIGAGLLLRTFLHLWTLAPGFEPANLLAAGFSLQDARYSTPGQVSRLFDDGLRRIRELPGVESAAVTLSLPYERPLNLPFWLAGVPRDRDHARITNLSYITPAFFETLRIPLLRGRSLAPADGPGSSLVAVVNEAFARQNFPGADPVGQVIRLDEEATQIVGVCGNLQQRPGWGNFGPLAPMPMIYVPAPQMDAATLRLIHTWFSPSWVVRAPASLARAIEQAARAADTRLSVSPIHTLDEVKLGALDFERFLATLLGCLSLLALALSTLGIYGLIANSVAERTRELGIRMALGSTVAAAVRTALRPALVSVAAGLPVGGGLALASQTVLRRFVWEIAPGDPATYVTVGVLTLVVAALACLAPAFRIATLDPAQTLRNE